MSKNIVGELFVRDRQHDFGKGHRVVMVAGVLRIDASVPLLGEHFHLVSGFMYEGKPLLLVSTDIGVQPAPEKWEGSRIDQIMCDRRWRIPNLKAGQYIGKPTVVEIERDYFS